MVLGASEYIHILQEWGYVHEGCEAICRLGIKDSYNDVKVEVRGTDRMD